MAILNSQGNLLTVDPTSKAARVTLYDSAGNKLLQETPVGSYILPFNSEANTTGINYVWYMKNTTLVFSAARIWYVRRMFGSVYFNGTAAAASTVGYGFSKFSGAGHNQSGTTLTAVKKSTSYGRTNGFQPNSTFAQPDAAAVWSKGIDAQTSNSGLVLDDKSWQIDDKTFEVSIPASVTGRHTTFDFQLPPFEMPLLPNEGLILKTTPLGTSIAGQGIIGFVEWDERSLT